MIAPRPLILLTLALGISHFARASERPKRAAPNILLILADDLGFSDLGSYGGEIQTPHLDRLAAGGLRFTQFYNTARCWPTRAALLTGYYPQQVRRDKVEGIPSGGGGTRPAWARLLPDMLRLRGYRSYHVGKWHIDGMPVAAGFDQSYYIQDTGRLFRPRVHYLDDQKLAPVAPDAGYYAPVAIADHAIAQLTEHAQEHPSHPFFLYAAYTSPHFPLQAPPEAIVRYADTYNAGWDSTRDARWARMREMGLIPGPLSDVEFGIGPPYDFPADIAALGPGELNRPRPWSDLNEAQRSFQATKMAVHAAMVDEMDRSIGRILDHLRETDSFENTLVLFLSDNGASAEIMIRDDGHDLAASPGSADTHLCLGPGWSTVANTPFRRHKTWVHEGGIATPLIVHWPDGIKDENALRHTPAHVIDIVPTLLEVAGAAPFATWNDQAVPPAPGHSLARALEADVTIAGDTPLWWLHEGNRALRAGDYKIVAAKDEPWSLYNLATDRAETHDLATEMPERVEALQQKWQSLHDAFTHLARQAP